MQVVPYGLRRLLAAGWQQTPVPRMARRALVPPHAQTQDSVHAAAPRPRLRGGALPGLPGRPGPAVIPWQQQGGRIDGRRGLTGTGAGSPLSVQGRFDHCVSTASLSSAPTHTAAPWVIDHAHRTVTNMALIDVAI